MNNKIIEPGSQCTIWLQSYDGFSTCVRKLNYRGLCTFLLNNLPHVGKSAITQCQHISCSWNNWKAAYLAMSIKPLVALRLDKWACPTKLHCCLNVSSSSWHEQGGFICTSASIIRIATLYYLID